MSKCINCQAELLPQSRFCGVCGTTQPSSTSGDEPENMETLRSNSQTETIPPANIPPPPPQPQANFGGIERTPSGQQEYKPPANNSPAQPNNPPSGPYPQPPAFYGDQPPQPANPQQPYSNYQPAPQTLPPSYGGYPYGPQSQPIYGGYQQPYGQYQQPPQSYNDYPQPQQLNDNYQQPQYPSGTYPPNAATSPNTGPAGAPPLAPGSLSKPKPPVWRWIIIGVVVIVILAGTGIGLTVLLKPHLSPTISVTSDYHDNNGKPVGATDTTLHVQGKQFAANSTITFLFDSAQFHQDMQPQSDASGAFNVDLTVPSNWPTGLHTLTARDASNNTTSTGADINIVQPGNNGTPGPNGAPTNTATFKINLEVQMSSPFQYELDITGQSDAQGGKVCSPGDDGSQQKNQYTSNGSIVTDTSTYTCTGTYKDGKITYDETLDTRAYTDDTGGNCTLNSQQPSYFQITGTYNTAKQFSGTAALSSLPDGLFTCTGDLTYSTVSGDNGTWTGGISNS